MKNLTLSLILAATLLACSKDETPIADPAPSHQIHGTWIQDSSEYFDKSYSDAYCSDSTLLIKESYSDIYTSYSCILGGVIEIEGTYSISGDSLYSDSFGPSYFEIQGNNLTKITEVDGILLTEWYHKN